MIEGQLVNCPNEFIVENFTVSPVDSEISSQIAALVRMSRNALSYSIR